MLHFVFKVNKTVKYKEETHNYKARKERQETTTYKNETKQPLKPEKTDNKDTKKIIRMLQTYNDRHRDLKNGQNKKPQRAKTIKDTKKDSKK